jgi:translation initiation factor IF-3
VDSKQVGVLTLGEALNLARANGVDLVEVSANAVPPVCRLVDYGKYRYEQAKKDKESKKHHHATTVKEVQLSPRIDPHDLSVKIGHAVDFLCEDMKVKVTLKFRGREMAHTEFGFQVVQRFITQIAPFGHPDFEPKLIGRGINVMISPLPRSKRARNPHATGAEVGGTSLPLTVNNQPAPAPVERRPQPSPAPAPGQRSGVFSNNPFTQLEVKPG